MRIAFLFHAFFLFLLFLYRGGGGAGGVLACFGQFSTGGDPVPGR